MATLHYWASECLRDGAVYTVIAKTKKEVLKKIADMGFVPNANGFFVDPENADLSDEFAEYGPVEKQAIFYRDAFHLLDVATGEGGGRYWAGKIC